MESLGKILFVVALYKEANALIDAFALKNVESISSFQIFSSDEVELIISGTGKIASAAATSYLLTRNSCPQVIINIGIAAKQDGNIGDLYLVDQIIDHDSGKNYYPDVFVIPACPEFYGSDTLKIVQKSDYLFKSSSTKNYDENSGKFSMKEVQRSSLRTVSLPCTHNGFTELIDMEASGFFEAAGYFLNLDKIYILKVLSDRAEATYFDPKNIVPLIQKQIPIIKAFLSFLPKGQEELITKNDELYIRSFMSDYYFTLTQERQFFSLLKNLCIQMDTKPKEILSSFCIEKEEGKNKKQVAKEILRGLEERLKGL